MRYFHQDADLVSDKNLHFQRLQDFNPFQSIYLKCLWGGFEFWDFFTFETLHYASRGPPSCPGLCDQTWIANLLQGIGAPPNCMYSTNVLDLRERKMFSEKSHLFWGQTHMQIQ